MYLLYQLLFYPFFLYSFHFHQATTPCSRNIYTFSLLYPLLILPNFIQIFFFLYLKFFCNAVVSACQPNHILCFYFFFQKFQIFAFPILTERGPSCGATGFAELTILYSNPFNTVSSPFSVIVERSSVSIKIV